VRELAGAWKIDLGSGEPCLAARRHNVQCFRTARSTLALISSSTARRADAARRLQPGCLRHARRTVGDAAIVVVDGAARSVPLLALADYWRGEFATFWRARRTTRARSSTAVRAGSQLAGNAAGGRARDSRPSAPLRRCGAEGLDPHFQLTQGLPSDGVAGPVTLMQLNRASASTSRACRRRTDRVSLILDALRRADSERERERGAVPGLHAQQMEPAAAETTAAVRALPWLAWRSWPAVLLAAAAWLVAGREAPRAAAAPAVAQSVAQARRCRPRRRRRQPRRHRLCCADREPAEPRPVAEPAPWTAPDGGARRARKRLQRPPRRRRRSGR